MLKCMFVHVNGTKKAELYCMPILDLSCSSLEKEST